MQRKTVLSISAFLIVVDIGVTAALVSSGERQLVAALENVAAIVDLIRDAANPIPRLDRSP